MRVLLLSTYDLGRQPFGLASPAAFLRAAGHEVDVADLSRDPLPRNAVRRAGLVAFFLPMHTATRLCFEIVESVRAENPDALLCGYGLYAPLNEAALREAGFSAVLGGEFEEGLVALAGGAAPGALPRVSLARQKWTAPDRAGLPPLDRYARLAIDGEARIAGYTEATRGCKHLCRHCPITPVYRGAFRVVDREVVLEDIRRQVAAGAAHITFGDPDFFNGPGHAAAIVEALHREWPALGYDVTIKIEHLLEHRRLLPLLRATGCVLVTSAVESLDDAVLEKLAKGHTRAGFLEALALMREADLPLAPTFIPFTPWTTLAGYRDFLQELAALDLAGSVAPVQLAIRLLIPAGSPMLELPDVRAASGAFDARALLYPWRHPDARVDRLAAAVERAARRAVREPQARAAILREIWELSGAGAVPDFALPDRSTIPYLTEPWYC